MTVLATKVSIRNLVKWLEEDSDNLEASEFADQVFDSISEQDYGTVLREALTYAVPVVRNSLRREALNNVYASKFVELSPDGAEKVILPKEETSLGKYLSPKVKAQADAWQETWNSFLNMPLVDYPGVTMRYASAEQIKHQADIRRDHAAKNLTEADRFDKLSALRESFGKEFGKLTEQETKEFKELL